MSVPQNLQSEEIIIQGVPASPGTVVGKGYVYKKVKPVLETAPIDDDEVSEQITLFKNARRTLRNRWEKMKDGEKNEHSRAILSAQIEIIGDPELSAQVEMLIKDEKQSVAKAIEKAFEKYIRLISDSGNALMEERLVDLIDIRDQLIEVVSKDAPVEFSKEGDVLVTEEVSPREVIQLSHQNVNGIVMEQGGHTSHAAIIARSMGMPAVVGAKGAVQHISDETSVWMNGGQGLVIINPSPETCDQARAVNVGPSQSLEEKIEICKRSSTTADEHPFILRANIEFPEELRHVDQFRAEGIGLLRTESVYLDRKEFGSVQKQVNLYEKLVEKTGDQSVTIRLFDVGGDKFQGSEIVENNPFLGWRGIRMLLDKPSILREQLKAILKVAGRYPERVKILLPMISTLDEIESVRNELEACQKELKAENEPVDKNIPIGMMVEIPSAAIQASYFAQAVDFFSIGTNDLTQYLLAVDRGNALISRMYDQQHPAIWQVINHVAGAARKNEIDVELCGELASYPVAAACLVGMGVSTLSMSPVNIPQVKKMLVQNEFKEMKKLAEQVLLCEDIDEVKSLFNNWENR